MEYYQGIISGIIYRNEENGYTVALLETDEGEEISIVGSVAMVEMGDYIRIYGQPTYHKLYGPQIEIVQVETPEFESEERILAYLSSGIIQGIGRKLGETIVRRFGLETMNILDQEPEQLLHIEGIGKRKLKKIMESYKEKRVMKQALMQLMDMGLTVAAAMKLYQRYESQAVAKVRENPYRLCKEIRGMGFLKADELAVKIGTRKDDLHRVMEGLLYVLDEAGGQGHTYLPYEVALERGESLLHLPEEKLMEGIYELCIQGEACIETFEEERRLYHQRSLRLENQTAVKLCRILDCPMKWEKEVDIQGLIQSMENKGSIHLAQRQHQAVHTALEHKLMILTGGPGTGKTTVVRFIISCFEEMNKGVALCAPTGRAAKRLSEATGRPAATVHRLLEAGYTEEDEDRFYKRDEDNPLEAQVIVVDEMSMVDIGLIHALLQAVKDSTILIFVGDSDQLPSVGPGNVLWDLIESNLIPTVTLNEVFRQGKESQIILNAHRINRGESMEIPKQSEDLFFMCRRHELQARKLVLDLIHQRLPEYFQVDPGEIQILTPSRKGKLGTREMNQCLQESLNPPSKRKSQFNAYGRIFRQGDKVMQIRNDYKKTYRNVETMEEGQGVFNGDIGFLETIDETSKEFAVVYEDGRRMIYEFQEADALEHAWAITVHKSQGCEFDVVILSVLSLPPMLQSRNILYTALTRAKRGIVLVGDMFYINRMISNARRQERFTSLGDRLALLRQEMYEKSEKEIRETIEGDEVGLF